MNYEKADELALQMVGTIIFENGPGLVYIKGKDGYLIVDTDLNRKRKVEVKYFTDGVTCAIKVSNLENGDADLFVMVNNEVIGNELLGIDISDS